MFDLNINFSALEELGKSVNSKAEEFESLLGSIRSANEELALAWQGTNASQYTSKVAEQALVMEKLQSAISEVGQQMISISSIYSSVDNDTSLR